MEHFRLNVVGVNAVILLGGKPVDQDDDNLSTPRILVNVSGKPVIQWLLDSVCLNANDTLHLVYHAEMERYPAFLEVMERAKSTQGVVAHPLFVDTRGPVETVLSLLQRMDATFLESPMITLDADTFYESDIVGKFREFCTDNCIFYSDDTDVSGPAVCSYIKTDSNLNGALVTQIKEKERISSNANTGAYGFKSGQLLLEYSRRVVDVQSSKGITTGYWMSSVYALMLQDQLRIVACKMDKFQKLKEPMQLQTFYANLCLGSERVIRICFDLDGTLVTSPLIADDYSTVKPLEDNIRTCRLLKEQGHTIIIYTGRGLQQSHGNQGVALKNVAKVTFDTLEEFDIPYDEIYFGKPHADVYIDGRAVNPTYSFMSQIAGKAKANAGSPGARRDGERRRSSTDDHGPSEFEAVAARSWNSLEFKSHTVTKYSPHHIIDGEAYWYENAPELAQQYIPRMLSCRISPDTTCCPRRPGAVKRH